MTTLTPGQASMNAVHYYWAHFFTIILSTMLSSIVVAGFMWSGNGDALGVIVVVIGLFTLFGGMPSSLLIERCLKRSNVWSYAVKTVLYPAAGMLLIIIFIGVVGGPVKFLFYDHTGRQFLYPALLQSLVYFAMYSVICFAVRRSLLRRSGKDGDDESGTEVR